MEVSLGNIIELNGPFSANHGADDTGGRLRRCRCIRIDCNVEAIELKHREDLRGVLSDDLLKLQDREAEKQIG